MIILNEVVESVHAESSWIFSTGFLFPSSYIEISSNEPTIGMSGGDVVELNPEGICLCSFCWAIDCCESPKRDVLVVEVCR